MKRIFVMLISLLLLTPLLTACGDQEGLQDGYYTAQASEFSHGWKDHYFGERREHCLRRIQRGECQRIHQELG